MYINYDETLKSEANSFDSQIIQRVKNGHIPDLQNCKDCDYFYNNSWRRRAYVQLDFVDQFNIIRDSIADYFSKSDRSKVRILEIGCGPGFMSLELARSGFKTTGLDISNDCISVAIATAEEYSQCYGENLCYECNDLNSFSELNKDKFEVVLFVGALHHFPDQSKVHEQCRRMLVDGGLFICHEPVRDKIGKNNAIVNSLITVLLSKCGFHYENTNDLLVDSLSIKKFIEKKYSILRYENENGEKMQSINDNEAGFAEIYPFLERNYETVVFNWRYGLFHELIGGLRCSNEDLNAKVAEILKNFDEIMCEQGIINSTEFFYVGKIKKSDK